MIERKKAIPQPPNYLQRAVPALYGVVVLLAFVTGVLWQKVQYLEGGTTKTLAAGDTTADTPAATTVTLDDVKSVYSKSLIKFGDPSKSKLLFVEVADPSCPYCHVAAGKNPELNRQVDAGGRFKLVSDGGTYLAPVEEMKKLVDQGKAAFTYIYTPGHGNGEMGTKAMYCGFEKGKFWQVHDLLMTNAGYSLLNDEVKNDKAKSGQLAEFLKSAVNANEMKACLDSGKYDSRISEEVTLATSLGVSGTPGFFVNEKPYAGAYSFKDMQSAVDAALN